MTPQATLRLIVATLVGACAGCSAPSGSAVDRWVAMQGGTLDGPGVVRLRSVAQSLVDRCTAGRGSLHVLNTDSPGAFAWPDERIYVTRGLLELLTDEELTAAVAHELGHLLDAAIADPPASVRGHPAARETDEESRADAIGVQLLREARATVTSMPQMLRKLQAAPALSDSCRQSIERRVTRLNTP